MKTTYLVGSFFLYTVYREILAGFFKPLSISLSADECKTGRIPITKLSLFNHNCVWANSRQAKLFLKVEG